MKIPQNLPRFSDYTREEALRLLLEKEYGCPPPQPDTLEFHVVRREEDAFAGKAVHATVEAWVTFQGRGFSFPFHLVCPKAGQPVPGVVLLNFTPAVPDPYLPSEELCDLGLAVASFHCGDVSPDNGDFTSKAGGLFQVDRSLPTAPGKLALWAWGASVVREYLAACPEIDQKAVGCGGPLPPGQDRAAGRRPGQALPVCVRQRVRLLRRRLVPGQAGGRPPRTSSGCSPIGSAPASPAAPGTQSSSPLTSTSCCPSSPPGSCTSPARRKTSGPTPPRSFWAAWRRLPPSRRPASPVLWERGRSPSWARPATRGTSATTCGRASISSAGRIGASSRRICSSTGKNKGTSCQSASNMV